MAYCRVRPLFGILSATFLLLVSPRADAAQEGTEPVTVRLRAEWSNPTASKWDGCVQFSSGRVISAQPLVARGGASCRILAGANDEFRFQVDGPASWGGVTFDLQAPPGALVVFNLGGHVVRSRLVELFDGACIRTEGGGWVQLRRDTSDMLRVHIDRPHLIFAPGDEALVDVEFNFLAGEPGVLATQLSFELRPARSAHALFARQAELQVPTNAAKPMRRQLEIRTPNNEGVYDLVLRAESGEMKPIERVVQFVVLSSGTPPARPKELVTRLVGEIDPSHPEVQGAWYSSRRLVARTSRLGQFLWRSVRHPFSSTQAGDESPVLVSRIKVQNVGRPHMLSVDYDAKSAALVTVSINEQDGDGRWVASPHASGVKIDKATSVVAQSHQLVFWPRTTSPSVSLYVEGVGGLAAVKKVRVLELPEGFPALDVHEPVGVKRLLGLSVDNPDAWSSWGSSRAVDAPTGLVVDDWQTFLTAADHLTEYARFAGYNCVEATVMGDGSALYPTRLLDTNCRLDSGSLAHSAPDPMRKDVVELLLRTCERAGVDFVPCLRLDGAVAALEARLGAGDAAADGIELVSREGKAWESQSAPAAAHRYNPLDPDVQAALLEVIREFVARYGSRPAFQALALDLGPQSHLVLPGPDWGYDDETIDHFLRDTGLDVLPRLDDDPGRFARRHQVLNGAAREQWLTWRGRQLATFFQSVLAELQQVKPDGRLVLNLTTLAASNSDDLREALRSARSVEDLLRSRGLDLRNWPVAPGIVVLRPYVATGGTPEAMQLNSSRELDELMAKLPARGSLCVQEPDVLYLASSDGPRAGEPHAETLTVPLTTSGRTNLRWAAHSLAWADCQAYFDGGPAVAFGQEQYQREFARVFRSLPAAEFRSVETLQPVCVRSHRDSRDTYVCLVNDASYAVETSLSFICSARTQLTNGSTGDKLTTQPTEQGLVAKIPLEPFQTVSLRVSSPEATLSLCSVKVPALAENGLKVRFDRLNQAMAILGRDSARTLQGLPPNGDFELADESGDRPARWRAEGDSAKSVLDRGVFHKGSGSLRLTGSTADGVASDLFVPPAARAVSLNVWLRADRPGVKVRWFLEGKRGDETVYRCYADVPVQTNWEQKQFRARDLPDGQLSEVQTRFQLLGDGALWIDDAEVCALPISKDEQRAIAKSVSAIFKAWTDRRLSDFERLADGYWATYLMENVEGSSEQPDRSASPPPPM